MNQKVLSAINTLYWLGVVFVVILTAAQWLAFAMAAYVTFPTLGNLSIPIFIFVLYFNQMVWYVLCELLRVPFRIEKQNVMIREELENLNLKSRS